MGLYADLIASGKYKRWKLHRAAIHPTEGPIYDNPQIEPLPGSRVKFYDTLAVTVVDDVGGLLPGGYVIWYINLFNFIKEKETKTRIQYITNAPEATTEKMIFDEVPEEKLGGPEQQLGGQ